jgi:hypothetical protein
MAGTKVPSIGNGAGKVMTSSASRASTPDPTAHSFALAGRAAPGRLPIGRVVAAPRIYFVSCRPEAAEVRDEIVGSLVGAWLIIGSPTVSAERNDRNGIPQKPRTIRGRRDPMCRSVALAPL